MFSVISVSLLFICQTHCSQASSFLPLLASNGSQRCAAGNPSYTLKTNDIIGIPRGVPGATKCAFYCTGLNSRITCTGFNYLTSGLCQFFSDPCFSSNLIPGCAYYQVTTHSQQSTYPSCKAILASSPNSPSGDYCLTTSTGRTLSKAYCEMGINGGGYTFFNPSDMKLLTNAEVQAMFTDSRSFLMRIRLTNGTQPYGVLEQLPAYSNQSLRLFLNSNPGYNAPLNSASTYLGGNYLYFAFGSAPKNTVQGLNVNGVQMSFINCDGNPNNYFALFPNTTASSPTSLGYIYTFPMFASILSALKHNPSTRVMSDDYFTFFEACQGGCGMYVQSDSRMSMYPLQDLLGKNVFVVSMAIGFR